MIPLMKFVNSTILGQKYKLYEIIQAMFARIDPPPSSATNSNSTSLDSYSILGFKEIRYDTLEQIKFIKTAFPCSRMILNYRRDTEKQLKSAFFKNSKYMSKDRLLKKNSNMEDIHKIYQETTYLMPLESFTLASFNHMLEWLLGDNKLLGNCSFLKVCHSNHNGTYHPCGARTGNYIAGNCSFDPHRIE